MKPRNVLIIGLILGFLGLVVYALLREVAREESRLAGSISGIVEVSPELLASGRVDIVKTDRLVLILVDPRTKAAVARRFESPLVPPQTIAIGLEDILLGRKLNGSYLLIGITDKDGEIFRVTPGEVYGRLPKPVPLGAERVRLVLDQPYRGGLFNRRD